MAKQSQPKVSEMIEVLIQQQLQSDKINTQISESLSTLIGSIKNSQLKVDVSELIRIEENSTKKRLSEFDDFIRKVEINNRDLMKVYKKLSSNRRLYIILLNVLLLLTTALSMYVAIKKTVEISEIELLVKKQKNQLDNVEWFFDDNPKTFDLYKEWNKDQ